eukprot:CAMPEP_0198427308 /NCGR_PEP_ID=MMETSP1452-20131203/5824_1 /TAXON_ID=1181717 /ORGANISM="Synchroma pusillum, Strain CCMP3072" /LENGTH=336 /DNA_ID=CAMNT_0044147687 /DNA_START=6 /DNA_END=1013 /DNA_ORIENTATION=-
MVRGKASRGRRQAARECAICLRAPDAALPLGPEHEAHHASLTGRNTLCIGCTAALVGHHMSSGPRPAGTLPCPLAGCPHDITAADIARGGLHAAAERLVAAAARGAPADGTAPQRQDPEAEASFGRYCASQGVKTCPTCGAWIFKDGGCNHMTCRRCNSEWNWCCMTRYGGPCPCRRRREAREAAMAQGRRERAEMMRRARIAGGVALCVGALLTAWETAPVSLFVGCAGAALVGVFENSRTAWHRGATCVGLALVATGVVGSVVGALDAGLARTMAAPWIDAAKASVAARATAAWDLATGAVARPLGNLATWSAGSSDGRGEAKARGSAVPRRPA